MTPTPTFNVAPHLHLLAEELLARSQEEDEETSERIAYLEEAMAGARLARRFTSPAGPGTPG